MTVQIQGQETHLTEYCSERGAGRSPLGGLIWGTRDSFSCPVELRQYISLGAHPLPWLSTMSLLLSSLGRKRSVTSLTAAEEGWAGPTAKVAVVSWVFCELVTVTGGGAWKSRAWPRSRSTPGLAVVWGHLQGWGEGPREGPACWSQERGQASRSPMGSTRPPSLPSSLPGGQGRGSLARRGPAERPAEGNTVGSRLLSHRRPRAVCLPDGWPSVALRGEATVPGSPSWAANPGRQAASGLRGAAPIISLWGSPGEGWHPQQAAALALCVRTQGVLC